MKADGTTLGADNGVGVAAALAVMESQDVAHGPLEFVFTIDEESGLTGASDFPEGLLKSQYFLNLDGEEEGTLCIGCAGGLNTVARRKVQRRPTISGNGWRLRVSGLQGGHSGLDINRGRGNAVRILGRLLEILMDRLPLAVADMQGGSKRNAIPREASATVVLDAGREGELRSLTATVEGQIRSELGGFDPGLKIAVESVARPDQILEDADARLIAGLLASLHHGVLAMSPDVPGLVQTSTNLATVSTQVRRGRDRDQPAQRHREQQTGRRTHDHHHAPRMADFEVEHAGGYPGWKPEPASDIVRKIAAGTPGDPRQDARTGRHARRPGVRRNRRETSGYAEDLFRAAYRGCTQPQRTAEDLFGCAVLRAADGAARASLIRLERGSKPSARTV